MKDYMTESDQECQNRSVQESGSKRAENNNAYKSHGVGGVGTVSVQVAVLLVSVSNGCWLGALEA